MKYNVRYSCITKHNLLIEITEVYSLCQDCTPIILPISTSVCDLDQNNYVYL